MWLSTCSSSTCLDLPSLTLGIQYHKQCFMFVYISSYSHIHVVYIDISKKKTACSAVHAVHVHSSKSTCIVLPLWLMHFMPQLARLICERLEPGRQGKSSEDSMSWNHMFFHFKWACNWKCDENLPYLYPKRKERHGMNYNEVRQVNQYHIISILPALINPSFGFVDTEALQHRMALKIWDWESACH